VLGPRIHTLSLVNTPENPAENLAATGDLDVRQPLVVQGAGRNASIVDGNDLDRVFELHNVDDVSMSGLTVRDGRVQGRGAGIAQHGGSLELRRATIRSNGRLVGGGNGGGIFSSGDLVVISTIVASNRASDGGGIALDDDGNTPSLTLRRSRLIANRAQEDGGGLEIERSTGKIYLSTVAGNRAVTADGGGIENDRSNLKIVRTTISGNRTGTDNGGGIANDQGTLRVYNSTISGNFATNKGGGIDNRFGSTLRLRRSTVVDNRAGVSGGGIANRTAAGETAGLARLEGTIVARNTPRNCGGGIAPISLGWNLSSDATCNLTLGSDLPSTAPGLGALANNGGPTLTHLPAAGSPALDSGIPAPGVDQRGVTRPQGPASDIGAVERRRSRGIAPTR
jgi:hypothetical protein